MPALSINDVAVLEGDSGTRNAVFTISLSNPGSEGITADFVVASGTAGPQDHFFGGGTVAFNRGETVQSLAVPVGGDTEVDSRETFAVSLTDAVNATIADGQGVATIVDEGYRMVAGDGGIFTFGERNFHGSTGNLRLNRPIVGGATDVSDDDGYWMVAPDGGVFAFGATTGQGYWLVAEDGGIFNFGDAGFFGSTGAMRLNAPVIDLAPSPDNGGYYLVARDGGVFTFGDLNFLGSTGAIRLNSPVLDLIN